MKRIVLALVLALVSTGANAACNPASAPPNSIGCQPAMPSNLQATDLVLGWRPSLGNTASRSFTPSQMLEAGLPGSFSTLRASGDFTLGGGLNVGTNLSVAGYAVILGNTTLGSTATVGSTLGVGGNFTVGANKFTVLSASGNTAVAGTLDATGTITGAGSIIAGNAGAAPITLQSGIISVPVSQSLSVRVQTAGQSVTFGAPAAGLGNALTITPQSGGNTQQSATPNTVSIGNVLSVPYFQSSVGASTDITGSGTYVPRMNINANVTGTNTAVGSTGPAQMRIAGTYSASMPNGIYNMIGIYENASGFNGALTGVKVQLLTTGTSSLTSQSFGLIATEFVSIGNHNLGGVSTGFGTTNFGVGVLFGANPRSLNKGGTYYAATVGQETGAAMYAGASSSNFVVHQLVLEDLHATHGIIRDAMLVLGAQAQVVVGTREGIEIGGRDYHWPIDTNGYIVAAHIPASWGTRPSVAAGGVDFNDVAFSGTGEWGGGFAFRGRGVSLIPSTGNGGALRAGFGSFTSSATGATLNVDQDQMTGTPTVNAGGTGWVQDQIAGDVYGNIVQLNVTAGVVTSVKAVINRAFVPTGTGGTTGVAFTAKNVVSLSLGTGLTLNLTWTPQTDLNIQSAGNRTIFGGPISDPVPVTKTTSFTMATAETDIICNGAGAITVTLPSAASNPGQTRRIKTIAALGVVQSATSNVVPLAGGAAGTAILAATAGKYAVLKSDGTNWIIMEAN